MLSFLEFLTAKDRQGFPKGAKKPLANFASTLRLRALSEPWSG